METTVAGIRRLSITGQQARGFFFFLVALFIFLVFGRTTEPGLVSTFVLRAPGSVQTTQVPDLVLPSQITIWVLAFFVAFFGGWQLARGFRQANAVLSLVIFVFIVAFLVWADRGRSFNLTGMLSSSLLRATPILLGALSGVLCERSGVINIAIEGMMLTGAFTGVVVASATDSLLLGTLAAALVGGLLAFIHAVLSIKYKVDQIISGTVINILAVGLTSYLTARILTERTELNASGIFPSFAVPGLVEIPVLGPVLFEQNVIVYLALGVMVLIHIMLFYSRWGLRTRAVGEHPRAADTLGVDVFRVRYLNVILGGMVAGLGGAYFMATLGRFDELVTAGRGFIGLAAMIFGKWTPFGGFASSLIFGFADALQQKLTILQVPIPSAFLLMAPYIATMIVLAGVVGRAIPPAADGQPYEKQ